MTEGREPSERLRVYLDTSVFSAYMDERAPERQELTREFWLRLPGMEVCTSTLSRDELTDTGDPATRRALLSLLTQVTVHSVTAEAKALVLDYVTHGVFAMEQMDDATHVAVAVLTRQDALVSWNFRHLVNRRRRAMVHEVNRLRELPMIEIISPPEV